jgi:hypothetical protein
MSFCNLSSCFSSIPILLLLFIVLLVVLGGFFFVYSFFTKKIEDQNHKLNSMVGLVSTMAHELQRVRSDADPQQPAPSSSSSYCLRGNDCDELLMCQRRIDVSDDEDDSDSDDEDDESEDSDFDDDDDSDEDEDDDQSSCSTHTSSSTTSSSEEKEKEEENPSIDNNIRRINMSEPFLKLDLDIDESTPVLETIKLDSGDDINDEIHIQLVKEELAEREGEKEKDTDDSIHKVVIHEEGKEYSDEDLKKMSTQKLKQYVVEKGLIKDPSKLNKGKLLKLLNKGKIIEVIGIK